MVWSPSMSGRTRHHGHPHSVPHEFLIEPGERDPPEDSRPVLGVRRQNSAGTEWELTATCVTAQEALGQRGAVRRPRQPLSAVQFASITHTKARDGFSP